jgi:hypothetical protein
MDCPSLEGAVDIVANADAGSASPADPAWRSRWLTVARRAWPVVTGLALVANLLALPDFARSQLTHTIRAELPGWHLSPAGYVAIEVAYSAVPMLIFLAVSSVIYLRAAREPVALFCAYMLVSFAFGIGGFLPGLTITNPVANALSVTFTAAAQVMGGWFFLVFPSGKFVPRWPRVPPSRSVSGCSCSARVRRSTGTAGSRPRPSGSRPNGSCSAWPPASPCSPACCSLTCW